MATDDLKYGTVTRSWGGKEIRREFDPQIEKWISQFDIDDQEIILVLLKHFQYYSSRKIKNRVVQLYETFLKEYNENPVEVAFIPVYKEVGVGFSDEIFSKFWLLNNLKDSAEKDIYKLLVDGLEINKVAIVDDYSGSGKTIIRTIEKCISSNPYMKNSIFYVLVIQMSEGAKNRINRYIENNGIDIRAISLLTDKKAFESGNIFSNSIEKKKEYLDICEKHDIHKKFYLGFDKTQALLTFEYNTPNNTLGIFWGEGDDHFAIFKRHKKKETTLTLIQDEAKKRKIERGKGVVKSHNEDERYIFLMMYLVNKDYCFNFNEAREKFGMSEEQLDEAIEYLLEEKYVAVKAGNVKPTSKLRDMVQVSKISELYKNNEDITAKGFAMKTYLPSDFEKDFSGY